MLGDARLTLAASAQQFDLIVLDAFSSDAIPVHLLTREALRGYLARLAPGGVILMHISNRHMELAKVVAAVGAAEGLVDDRQGRRHGEQVHRATSAPTRRSSCWRATKPISAPLARAGWEKADSVEGRGLDRRLLRHHGRDPAQKI